MASGVQKSAEGHSPCLKCPHPQKNKQKKLSFWNVHRFLWRQSQAKEGIIEFGPQ